MNAQEFWETIKLALERAYTGPDKYDAEHFLDSATTESLEAAFEVVKGGVESLYKEPDYPTASLKTFMDVADQHKKEVWLSMIEEHFKSPPPKTFVSAVQSEMKMYVWKDVLCDYTCGVIFAAATNPEEARKALKESVHESEWGFIEAEIGGAPEEHPLPFGGYCYGGA